MGKKQMKAGMAALCITVCACFVGTGGEVKANLVIGEKSESFEPQKKEDKQKGEYYQIVSKNGDMTNILIEMYRLQSEGYELNGWLELNGDFYYKQGNEILTGLHEIDREKYFFDNSGKMQKNCWGEEGEKRYFFGEDGTVCREEAVEIEGKIYCFDKNGIMYREKKVTFGGQTWYVGEDGAAVTDQFVKIEGETYYFDKSGRMTTGLIAVDGEEYYMGEDGAMKKGWQVVRGRRYLFHMQTGKMLKGVTIGDIVIDENGRCELPTKAAIEMEELMQNPELPTGCESVALTMVLRYYGFGLEKTTIADEYLDYSENDFVTAYVGNPHTESGAGCFAPAIEKAANKFLNSQNSEMKARDISPTSMEDLYAYLANGTPVIVWNSMYMTDLERMSDHYIYEGKTYYWYRKEHCVVLCGYDRENNTVLVNDPLEGMVQRDAARFEELYDEIGQMAVVIDPS